MQSEIRVHCRASRSFWCAGNVPVPRRAAQRFLCLAEEPAEPAGSGRSTADRSDPQSLERQRQGLWLPQAARRPSRSRRDLLSQPHCAVDQAGGHQGSGRYKRRPVSYGGKPSLAVDNTLDRQFDAAAPDRVWVTDITYIRTLEGFAYLAVVIDLYSRRVVGGRCKAGRPPTWC